MLEEEEVGEVSAGSREEDSFGAVINGGTFFNATIINGMGVFC